MNTFDRLSDRGTHLVSQARRTLESTSSHLPKLLEAGAVMGVAKTGVSAAAKLARRNPGVLVAIGVLGAGVLAYRFYRRRANAQTAGAKPAISGKVDRDGAGEDADVAVAASDGRKRKSAGNKRKSRPDSKPQAHH